MEINSIRDMAAMARGRRKDLGLSQADSARRVGVSRLWINQFEGGKSTAEIGLVVCLLDALNLRVDLTPRIGSHKDFAASAEVDLDDLLDDYGDQ
jgi:HTH-type transcriptional regulator / antitoxin HipB